METYTLFIKQTFLLIVLVCVPLLAETRLSVLALPTVPTLRHSLGDVFVQKVATFAALAQGFQPVTAHNGFEPLILLFLLLVPLRLLRIFPFAQKFFKVKLHLRRRGPWYFGHRDGRTDDGSMDGQTAERAYTTTQSNGPAGTITHNPHFTWGATPLDPTPTGKANPPSTHHTSNMRSFLTHTTHQTYGCAVAVVDGVVVQKKNQKHSTRWGSYLLYTSLYSNRHFSYQVMS